MTVTFKAYSEKRSFIRMKIDTMVSFKIENGKEYYEGRCINLSGAGMLIETVKKLSNGTKLTLTVPAENNELSNLNASVEVMRVTHLQEQHKYQVGLIIRKILS